MVIMVVIGAIISNALLTWLITRFLVHFGGFINVQNYMVIFYIKRFIQLGIVIWLILFAYNYIRSGNFKLANIRNNIDKKR